MDIDVDIDIEQAKIRLDEMAANNAIEGLPLTQDRIDYFKSLIDQGLSSEEMIRMVFVEHTGIKK
jgi:hypothetical protein